MEGKRKEERGGGVPWRKPGIFKDTRFGGMRWKKIICKGSSDEGRRDRGGQNGNLTTYPKRAKNLWTRKNGGRKNLKPHAGGLIRESSRAAW